MAARTFLARLSNIEGMIVRRFPQVRGAPSPVRDASEADCAAGEWLMVRSLVFVINVPEMPFPPDSWFVSL